MIQRYVIFLFVVIATPSVVSRASASSGSVELDILSFDKIISKFDASLVKFDVAFPYGDKHDAFVALAKDAKDMDELLIAEVGVKDYGEKDNEDLAKKYGASKDNFPIVKLFIKGKSEPIPFDDSKGFTSDELRKFVKENTGLYFSLPGCVRQLDQLAAKFMASTPADRKLLLEEAEGILKQLKDKDSSSGKIYKLIMEKIIERGTEFVNGENERVKKILAKKLSDEKRKELGVRLNILQTFQVHSTDKTTKEDL